MRDLVNQGIKAFKLGFPAQTFDRPHPQDLAVDVTIKIKNIGFNLADRYRKHRADADIGGRRVPLRVIADFNPCGIDAIGRVQHIAERDIGGRVTDGAAAFIAMLDHAAHFPIPAEHGIGMGDITKAQGLTDGGGGQGAVPFIRDFVDDGDGQAGLAQRVSRAAPHLAEGKIITDNDMRSVKARAQDAVDKLIRGLRSEIPVEGQGEQVINATFRQAFSAQKVIGQAKGRVIRAKHAARVRLEAEDPELLASCARDCSSIVDQGTMPAMDAIEIADDDNAILRILGQSSQGGVRLHTFFVDQMEIGINMIFWRNRFILYPMIDTGFEYLAIGPQDESPRKLAVLLHGYGRNSTYMRKLAEDIRVAAPAALVICLNAPEALDIKAIAAQGDHVLHIPEEIQTGDDGLHPQMQRQWFPIEGGLKNLMPRLRGMAGRINAFVDMQRDMLGLGDGDIAIAGFSQGAGTALYTAYTRAVPLAGLVCHSSIVLDRPVQDPLLRSAPSTLYIYGADDPEFPQARYEESFEWVRHYTGGRAVHEKIAGLGHYTNAQSRKICATFIGDVFGD